MHGWGGRCSRVMHGCRHMTTWTIGGRAGGVHPNVCLPQPIDNWPPTPCETEHRSYSFWKQLLTFKRIVRFFDALHRNRVSILSSSCFAACGHHLSLRIAIVMSLLLSGVPIFSIPHSSTFFIFSKYLSFLLVRFTFFHTTGVSFSSSSAEELSLITLTDHADHTDSIFPLHNLDICVQIYPSSDDLYNDRYDLTHVAG